MDRPLDPTFVRTRRVKRLITGVLALGLGAAVIAWVPGWLRPTVSRSRVRTALVDVGVVEATVSASGAVVPEIEQVISSPLDARVLRILKRAGDRVRPGEPVVQLDVTAAELAATQARGTLALKSNQQARTRLALEKTLVDLDTAARLKQLQLESLRASLARNHQLFKERLISEEQLKQAELSEAQAAIELQKLEAEKRYACQTTASELEGLTLERGTLEQQSAEARRQLGLATPKAEHAGVVTWALTEEGGAIRRGDLIARVADLSSFRVEATVSDVHAKRIAVGLPVAVKINDDVLEGQVATIQPTIKDGTVTFLVALAEKSSSLLRPNLRVDVIVITGRKPRALRVQRGPFVEGEGSRNVFVVRGDRAVRTPIELGLAGVERLEVVRGLAAGDEIIISDMSDYQYLREIRLR